MFINLSVILTVFCFFVDESKVDTVSLQKIEVSLREVLPLGKLRNDKYETGKLQ